MFLTIAGVAHGRSTNQQRRIIMSIFAHTESFLTLQVNCAGSCPATSFGLLASQSTRYSLVPVDCFRMFYIEH